MRIFLVRGKIYWIWMEDSDSLHDIYLFCNFVLQTKQQSKVLCNYCNENWYQILGFNCYNVCLECCHKNEKSAVIQFGNSNHSPHRSKPTKKKAYQRCAYIKKNLNLSPCISHLKYTNSGFKKCKWAHFMFPAVVVINRCKWIECVT